MTETIEIAITEGREEAFGWRVDCEACDYTDRMLSEEGALNSAQEHMLDHVKIVSYPREGGQK